MSQTFDSELKKKGGRLTWWHKKRNIKPKVMWSYVVGSRNFGDVTAQLGSYVVFRSYSFKDWEHGSKSVLQLLVHCCREWHTNVCAVVRCLPHRSEVFTLQWWCLYPVVMRCLPCSSEVFTLQWWCLYPAVVICLPCSSSEVFTLHWWCLYPALVICLPSSSEVFTLQWWGGYPHVVICLPCSGEVLTLQWWTCFTTQWWSVYAPNVVRCVPCFGEVLTLCHSSEVFYQFTLQW